MIRSALCREHGSDLRDPRAAQIWESAFVYRPAAALVRARRLNRRFPGERTADLFVRLADLREAEACSTDRLPDWEEVSDHLLNSTLPTEGPAQ